MQQLGSIYERLLEFEIVREATGALTVRPNLFARKNSGSYYTPDSLVQELLDSALDATRAGGVVAYVTCSPHLAETRTVVDSVTRRRGDVELLDAVAAVREVAPGLADLGPGPTVQLWPHRHGTDAMFLALLRRTG